MNMIKRLGHYEISQKIGSGAMGQVYRARDTRLGREVAIKLLPFAVHDPMSLDRFRREAKALAALNHPNIVTVYSIDEADDSMFLTMELVEGRSLDQLISEPGMDLPSFEKIAIPLAQAVAAAHSKGIIHRDLKPANIVISGDGDLKVLDFGVARILSEQPITDADTTVGTAAYMSPEQISGGEIDGRSDLFSLGVIFYELISGKRPFRGDHPAALMYSIVNDEAPHLSNVPGSLTDLVDKCLMKDPAERFESVRDLCASLKAYTVDNHRTSRVTIPSDVQAAFDRGDLAATHKILHKQKEQRDLLPGELEMFGSAADWMGIMEEAVQAREQAYAMYTRANQNVAAARVALELMYNFLRTRTTGTVAHGWQMRAERLLENAPECVEHGWLLRYQAMVALGKRDFESAAKLNRECASLAHQFSDVNLQATALHDQGQIFVAAGEVEKGTALVDEAMTSAMSGELNPITVGLLCCRTLSVCQSLADFNRAREWSEVAFRWCEPLGPNVFQGICRVHNAETMRHHGQWVEALDHLRSASSHFVDLGQENHAGEAFYQIGELNTLQGRYADATEAFRRAHECGRDPVPGLPLLRLAEGQGQVARKMIDRALSETTDNRLDRARLLGPAIVIALANNDSSTAQAAVDELVEISGEFNTPCFKAHGLLGRGTLELERGQHAAATATLREAWSTFHELNFPYDAARARVLLARAYISTDDTEDARMQLEAARKTFSELGAPPDLELVDHWIDKLQGQSH